MRIYIKPDREMLLNSRFRIKTSTVSPLTNISAVVFYKFEKIFIDSYRKHRTTLRFIGCTDSNFFEIIVISKISFVPLTRVFTIADILRFTFEYLLRSYDICGLVLLYFLLISVIGCVF